MFQNGSKKRCLGPFFETCQKILFKKIIQKTGRPDDVVNNLSQSLRICFSTFRAHVLEGFQLPGFQEEPGHSKRPFLRKSWKVVKKIGIIAGKKKRLFALKSLVNNLCLDLSKKKMVWQHEVNVFAHLSDVFCGQNGLIQLAKRFHQSCISLPRNAITFIRLCVWSHTTMVIDRL